MIVNRLMRSKMQLVQTNCMASQTVRAFGGGPIGDPNHKYEYVEIKDYTGNHTKLKVPQQADIDYMQPKKGDRNAWFHMWLNGKWDPTQDEKLDNSKVNRLSMYHHLRSNPLSGLLFTAGSKLFK